MGEVDVELDLRELSRQVTGLVVAELTQPAQNSLAMHFENGAVLVFKANESGFSRVLSRPDPKGRPATTRPRPTRRQREYLEFIKKYVLRFGVAPAEKDIERHFLVSAPSVNQMIRTLERRGFIERDRDGWSGQAATRSIRVLWDE